MPAQLRLEAGVDSPARARAFARRLLVDAAEQTVATAELVVSELVTNAVVHACGEVLVVVNRPPGWARVEVHDRTAGLDRRPVGGDDERGRGLKLVGRGRLSWSSWKLRWRSPAWHR